MEPRPGVMLKLIAAFIILQACGGTVPDPSTVQLINNGYEGVVVAIHENIREDEALVQSIQNTFTVASKELFIATRQRAYFRNITILIPKNWTSKTYQRATWHTYSKAAIRVEHAREIRKPFVTHYTKCGQPGEFMYLPKAMFFDREYKQFLGNENAVPAKEIVHEWAHLRWGLFDEYPVADSGGKINRFYKSSLGQVKPTLCSGAVDGRILCPRADASRTLQYHNEKCRFRPKRDSKISGAASYLYDSSLRNVNSFCDNNASDIATLHDNEAPTRQNMLCDGRSAWEVMRTHVDFADSSNPPLDQDTTNTVPHFTLVQRNAGTYVFVMDISGSMTDQDNHNKLSEKVQKYILTGVPDGSTVGLVRFDDHAEILTPTMQRVDTEISRQRLASLVRPLAVGGTSIGAGMQAAYDLLLRHGQTAGSVMYVITDGAENTPPMISEVIPRIKEAGIIIQSILLTANAEMQLINSSSMTGGRSFFLSGNDDTEDIADVLMSMTAESQESAESLPIKLSSKVIHASEMATSCEPVIVDEELGKELELSFTWKTQSHFKICLASPNGQQNYTTFPERNKRSHFQAIPGISEAGKWNVCITNLEWNQEIQVTLHAQSKARDAATLKPVAVSFSLSRKEVNYLTGSAEPLVLYASVTKGYLPVINATVIATIEDGTGTITELELRDNGAGADSIKDDGTYSRYLPVLTSTGMYSTKVRVEGNDGTAVVSGLFGSMSGSDDDFEDFNETLPVVTKTPIPQFERQTSGELIQVVAVQPSGSGAAGAAVDSTPPSRIQDLTLLETSFSSQTITVQFTAVGDDFDEGTATRYHIRHAPTYQRLRGGFDNCTKINDTDVVNGTLASPLTSGGVEAFTLRVATGTLMVIAVVAEDEAGNVGLPSNFIVAQLAEEPTVPPTAEATVPPAAVKSVTLRQLLAISLGGVAAVVLFVMAIVIAGVLNRRKRFGKANLDSCEEGTDNVVFHASTREALADIPSETELHDTNDVKPVGTIKTNGCVTY